jgi:hypothetical protein
LLITVTFHDLNVFYRGKHAINSKIQI